ncbi:MAG: glycoside hydrolase family 127 protein, partial [Clostridia bacterium]|nr:glycoside hydrolase family 127 protein [Clostridia bacterium]
MSIYQPGSAYATREKLDTYFMDPAMRLSLTGKVGETLDFITEFQLLHPDMWARFVRQFVEHTDVADRGWRGEYWGKMMRGATFVYEVTRDPALFAVLRDTVADMMAAADADGRISSYTREAELSGWDLWCRKYVILGMQYFMEISEDEAFNARVLTCIEGQIGALMQIVGDRAEGKTPVTYTSNYWRGLNASSVLEPVVRTYNLTGKQVYLDFAAHIVGEGFTQVDNLIELALTNQAAPYQYPITKAYEMSSCFMGLLEYYRVTGVEKYRTAVENFAAKVLETDFTIAGSGGMEHELFGHSTVRQANTNVGGTPQETCVTVTLMQLFSQLALFTGDAKYLDAFERSLYNAYLGAVNTEKVLSKVALEMAPDAIQEPLPFDSYSPLTAATRGSYVGGFKVMPDGHYYGCCACIGAAGIGLAGKMALLRSRQGLALALYVPGTYQARLPDGTPL